MLIVRRFNMISLSKFPLWIIKSFFISWDFLSSSFRRVVESWIDVTSPISANWDSSRQFSTLGLWCLLSIRVCDTFIGKSMFEIETLSFSICISVSARRRKHYIIECNRFNISVWYQLNFVLIIYSYSSQLIFQSLTHFIHTDNSVVKSSIYIVSLCSQISSWVHENSIKSSS